MRRGPTSGILANPVLVGAVTILVTMVAVFLAYNANNGLPFVPTTKLDVQLPNGANLVRGNEVRSGGYRVGVIERMEPAALPDGSTGALVSLKLDKRLGDISKDTKVVVRARSALGLKYLDLQEGSSRQFYRDGDTIPLARATVPVDLDEVLSTFDEKTRRASQVNLGGFGDTFAGRGRSVGRAIEELRPLVTHLEPVARNLADEDTELKNFFKELSETVTIVEPVSETNARTFTTMANTFEAIGRDEAALKSFIEKSPPTLDVSTDSLRVQRPFLTDLTSFSRDFQGATRALRNALPTVNRAVARGIGVQRRAVAMNTALGGVLDALRNLAEPPATSAALRGLGATVATLNPQLKFYGPYVTVCNYWNYFWTFAAEHFSEQDTTGEIQRALLNTAGSPDSSVNSHGDSEATGPANGQLGPNPVGGIKQYFHGATFNKAVDANGNADCESGQRGYVRRNAKHFPKEYNIELGPRTPGLSGPTFAGRARVPAGQTFSDLPTTGPYARANQPESEFGE